MNFTDKLSAFDVLADLSTDTQASSFAQTDVIAATPGIAAGAAVVGSAVAAYAVTEAID